MPRKTGRRRLIVTGFVANIQQREPTGLPAAGDATLSLRLRVAAVKHRLVVPGRRMAQE
jgi:hypothetical protein